MSTIRNGKRNKKAGSTVQEVVRVRAVRDSVLFLAPRVSAAAKGQAQSRLRGVAVIEVEGTTFSLRSEEDQAALILGYQALLKAIPPGRRIQILIRRQPHSLSDAVARLDALASERGVPAMYQRLAAAHADHLERLSGSHPLYRSRCYLVLSASDERRSSFSRTFLSLNRKRRRRVEQQRREQTMQDDLNIQCERFLTALANVGLSAHRLHDTELARLAASCLVPDRDEQRAFPDLNRLAIGEPVWATPVGTRVSDPLLSLTTPNTTVRPHENLPPDAGANGHRAKKLSTHGDDVPPAGWTQLADLLAPSALEERPNEVQVEGEYVRGLAVVGYPREVTMGFLAPLLTHDDHLDISIHIQMQDPSAMLRRYRRRKAELRASKRLAARQGWVDNPDEQVAASDVERLLLQVASRQEMLCEVGLYIQVHGKTTNDLDERTDRLLARLRNLLLVTHPTTFEHLAAYHAMQPWSDDRLGRTTLLDTMSLAYTFPFVSNALIMAGGVLEGVTATGEPVIIDDWADELDNPHRFIGAVTGAGKSYACKLKMLRELLMRYHEGVQVAVIDPEREYERLCTELGGTFVRLAPGSVQHLNPFDLVPPGLHLSAYLADHSRGDRLAEKVQTLHALYDLMLSDRGPTGVAPLVGVLPDGSGNRQHSNERHTRPVALVDEEVSPEPSPQPLLDEAFLWHEEQQGQESGEAEETMATTNDLESAQAASTRRRGGRGKGSTQPRTGTASEQGARGTSGSVSQAGDLPLASPYVLNESARARPRTRVWQPEEALGDESGEMRGE